VQATRSIQSKIDKSKDGIKKCGIHLSPSATLAKEQMTVPSRANGNGPSATDTITRTQSFTPITPVVKERVGDVALRLTEV
jgi:hypothetical protein